MQSGPASDESKEKPEHPRRARREDRATLAQFLADYFWFILKNVIGWIFILGSPVLGLTLPGPGGIPMFLIGFALVTFPGKRKLTSRVLRGRSMHLEASIFTILTAIVSISITSGLIWFFAARWDRLLERYNLKFGFYFGICLLAFVVTWLTTRLMLQLANYVLRRMPAIRRWVRPRLKKLGINLLPSRRKAGDAVDEDGERIVAQDEIINIDQKQITRFRKIWSVSKPWIRRALAIGLTAWILTIMIRPLRLQWDEVKLQLKSIETFEFVGRFIVASMMFAIFLFLFRAVSWRRILKGFGHKLPTPAATRIWSMSELWRYLPGSIWQVLGRVYLIKPYGVSASVSSTSQILELGIFLFANVLLAGSCLLWFGAKMDPHARPWLIKALCLVPMLAILLHPKIFYGVANTILKQLGKPPIVKRLRGFKLVLLLGWAIIGLLWQSLAVYLITAPSLHLKIDWWWVVAGAYCLAWTAGFLAFLSPAGMGVRELVFVATIQVVIPPEARANLGDPATFQALIIFLAFILRLWTIVGELLMSVIAHLLDYRGALNLPDAPGRITHPAPSMGGTSNARSSA